ncbi:MAG TPA: UDP-4-amino-4,6-dideoxy-N-acetyl-beta-L-altrosamine transaminase [Burkholderiales bacterium]|nr:UDP-4-amino-4,6-dideoxy-N-acetyl-beta-L-altrosamine transaminase [Burkholderiales bacterium]
MSPIPYARQSISQADIDAVVRVLRSDWLTQGPDIERFEKNVATACGAQHAIAVSNGTAALHLACMAFDLGPGDLLWTSPNTFAASANCARYCGADVDFVDIDSRTYNLSVPALEEKLARAKRAGRLPKVLVPVHFGGQSCDMEAIGALAGRYGFRVVEDASHAVGAEYRAARVGACQHSDIAVFSFHPVKILTTGEGGMLMTNDHALARKLRLLRTHGITRDRSEMQGESEGPWYYQQVELGYNYRMTEIQAALGASQLVRLDEFLSRRRELAHRYDALLKGLPLATPSEDPAGRSSWHLYVIQLELEALRKSRGAVFERMRAAGVLVNVHYIPVHMQPYYRALGFKPGDFPASERYYERAISLPLYFGLSDADQDRVVDVLRQSVS